MKNKYYIDTNIFIRFFVFDEVNPHLSRKAKKVFSMFGDKKLILCSNVLVIAEVVYVLDRFYEISEDQIMRFLLPIVSSPNFVIDNKENVLASLAVFVEKNVDFEDAYSYFDMLDKDVAEILTFDEKHFGRFEDVKVASFDF